MSKSVGILLGVALLVVGGLVLWNAWVLGFLNHGVAGYTQMSISELNVAGQPFAKFFTDTEWLSGLFILLGALLLIFTTPKNNFLLVALCLTALIGGLTIFDATHPLDCNRYQNEACALRWARGEVSGVQEEHGLESETTDYITILFGIELVVWALYARLKNDMSYIELGAVIVLAIAIAAPLLVSTNSIVTEAVGQRIWNTLTSLAFLYIIYKIGPTKILRKADYSHLKTRKAMA